MTDNEIIKALECIGGKVVFCKNCAYNKSDGSSYGCVERAAKDALDLINRLKAENERLQKYNTDVAYKHYNDGIKEFAERVKAYLEWYSYVAPRDIDNLVKEMVGDTE